MTVHFQRRSFNGAIAALGLGATLSLLAPFASAQTVADIKKKGEITVGMLVDFPPYGTMNTSNQPDGYDADVAKLLAKDLGVTHPPRAASGGVLASAVVQLLCDFAPKTQLAAQSVASSVIQ